MLARSSLARDPWSDEGHDEDAARHESERHRNNAAPPQPARRSSRSPRRARSLTSANKLRESASASREVQRGSASPSSQFTRNRRVGLLGMRRASALSGGHFAPRARISSDRDRRPASEGGPMLPVGRHAVRPSRSSEPMPPFASARSTRSRPSTPTTSRSARVRSASASARSARSISASRSRSAFRFSSSAFRAVCALRSRFSDANSSSSSERLAMGLRGGGGGGFERMGSRRLCSQSSTGFLGGGGGGGFRLGGGGGGLARGGGGAASRTAVGGGAADARRGGAGVALGRRRRKGNAASSMSWRRAMSMAGRLAVRGRAGGLDARRAGVGTIGRAAVVGLVRVAPARVPRRRRRRGVAERRDGVEHGGVEAARHACSPGQPVLGVQLRGSLRTLSACSRHKCRSVLAKRSDPKLILLLTRTQGVGRGTPSRDRELEQSKDEIATSESAAPPRRFCCWRFWRTLSQAAIFNF